MTRIVFILLLLLFFGNCQNRIDEHSYTLSVESGEAMQKGDYSLAAELIQKASSKRS